MKQKTIYTLLIAATIALAACNAEDNNGDTYQTGMATVGARLEGLTPSLSPSLSPSPSAKADGNSRAEGSLCRIGNSRTFGPAAHGEMMLHSGASPLELPSVLTDGHQEKQGHQTHQAPQAHQGKSGQPGATTRSTPNPIYKTQFSSPDRILLRHHHGAQPTETEMIFNGTTWRTYDPLDPDGGSETIPINIAGDTRITAEHHHQPDDIQTLPGITTYGDRLSAEATPGNGITPNGNQYRVDLSFRHTRTLINIYKVKHADGKTDGMLTPGTDVTLHITDAGGTQRTLQSTVIYNTDEDRYEAHFIIPHDARINTIDFTASLGAIATSPYTAYPADDQQQYQPGTIYAPVLTIGTPNAGATFRFDPDDIAPWVSKDIPGGYTHNIVTADDLFNFATLVNTMTTDEQRRKVRAIQSANIDLTGRTWTPIGTAATGENFFMGLYNGNGYTITGLTIPASYTGTDRGLFGFLRGAQIVNVHLKGVDVDGTATIGAYPSTGALAGYAYGSYIALCTAQGQVKGSEYTGGLVGGAGGDGSNYTHITRCASQCQVTTTYSNGHAGGLVGYTEQNTHIVACMASGNVESSYAAGGLVGYNVGAIYCCYAIGDVTGGTYAGGLAGFHNSTYGGNIQYSYTTADKLAGNSAAGNFTGCWDKTYGIANPNTSIYSTVAPGGGVTPLSSVYTWMGDDTGFAPRTFYSNRGVWKDPGTAINPTLNYDYNGE